MSIILTAAQMRAAETAIFARGVEDYALMERAGRAAAQLIWRAGGRRATLILCGPGNNGGDGYVIARTLRDHGVPVRVAASAEPATASAKQARADWGGAVEDIRHAQGAAQVVDALFGIGLTRGLAPDLAGRLCDLGNAAELCHAIDVPSGVETDTGALLSPVPHYTLTIALGALKPAHVLRPGARVADQLLCCDIGVDPAFAQMRRLAKPRLSAPADDAHKYTRGLVAVVAGDMPGAAALGAQAAAHGGAGYVRLVGAQAIVDLPHAIVRASGKDESALDDPRIACLLVGPGGSDADKLRTKLPPELLSRTPAVLDAAAVHFARNLNGVKLHSQTILTPHEGEFRAVFGEIAGSVIDRARVAAQRSNAVVILKGATTIIAAPDGRIVVADRATSWLSTAGTGDVLAGLCASRLAVGGDAFAAACEAVWLHGEAARLCGPAFIADDLIAQIPAAIRRCL